MTWTYNLATLLTTPKDQVRLMIGDAVATSPLIQDEEIAFYLTQDPSIWRVASRCCRAIAAGMAREGDTVQSDLKQVLSVRARAYNSLAAQYANDAVGRGGGLPYAGGISVFDKIQQELNPDRVSPQFNLGMTDNVQLPVGPVGNETESQGNAESVEE